MEILNVGLSELLIILILMFVLLGPKEMIRTAARIGAWVRKVIKSPMWKEVLGYSQEIRELPQKLMDESGLKETLEEVRRDTQAATDEINTQIKEVTEAARVKEAEHVRIEYDPKETNTIAPSKEKTVEKPAPAVVAPEPEKMSDAEAADVPASTAPASTAPASTAPASTAPAADAGSVTPAAAPVPAAAGSGSSGSLAGAIAAAAAAAASAAAAKAEERAKKASASKKPTDATPAVEPAAAAAQQEVAAQEVPVAQEVAVAQEVPAQQEVAAQEVPAQQEVAAAQQAVKTRKPRRKKGDDLPTAPESEAPATVPVTLESMAQQEQSAPQPQRETAVQVDETPRKPRARKSKPAETVSLGGARAYPEPANGNGSSAGNGAESAVKPARKPRAPKSAATRDEPTAIEEPSHRDAA